MEKIFAHGPLIGKLPEDVEWSPDGQHLTYLDGGELIDLDPGSAKPHVLVSRAKLAALEGAPASEQDRDHGLATTTEEAAAVGAEAKQRGLKIIAMWSDEFPTDKNDGLEHLIDNAAACGCPNLLLGGTDERRAEAYYRTVAACCDYAASKRVLLGVKPHGGTNANGARCRKIIDQIGNKNFRLWYDPGNIFYYSDGKLDPVDDAAAVNGVVAGMCVKDFRPPKDVELTPGTGQVNFAKVLARLQKGGFTHGPLVVECLEHGDLDHVNAEAVKARKFLESLTGQKA